MGCLIANITKGHTLAIPNVDLTEKIEAKIGIAASMIEAVVKAQQRVIASTSIGERVQAKVGMVCSVPEKFIIFFTKKGLVWEGETNQEGVILYNTLAVTGEWSLEEIEYEELL